MADGTVRGAFDLNAEPAIRAQRGIRDSALEADQAVRGLGGSLDDLAGTAVRSSATVKESWRSMKDSISDDARQIGLRIDEVDGKLDKVSRKRVTPHIDVTGIDRAIARIEVLDARLDALSRQRATPRVAVGGGFSGGAQSLAGLGGGAGGAGGRAARGGWFPKGFPTGPALIGAAGTAIPPLVGTTVGLAASASSAAIGAGELGLAGLGVGAAGIVPEAIVARQESKQIQQAMKDQTAYNQAVAQYGQYSKQAETAHSKLDAEFAQHPGLRSAIHSVDELSKAWENASKQARNQFDIIVSHTTADVARALPALRPGITRDAFATRTAADRFSDVAFSGTSLQTMQQLQTEFARDLPHVEHTMENLLNVTDHLVQASLPYFHEGVVWIDHMTSGWSQWSNSTTNVDHAVSSTVTSLKDWAHFGGAAVRVVKDLFAPATQPGDSAVVSMTHTLDRWDTWLKDNPEKVRSFIHDAEHTAGNVAHAVLAIADALFRVASAFGPVLSAFAQLASFGSGTGLLIPSAIRYGLGKYIGGPGGAAAAGGGVTAAEAAAAGGGAYGLARAGGGVVAPGGAPMGPGGSWLVPPAASVPLTGSATTAEEAAAMAYMMGLRPTARIGGGLPGGELATPEAFAARYGGVEGARFAAPYSALGAQESLLARARGGVRSAAGGAARFMAPVLAVQAGIGALTTQGGFLNRAQGAASAVTFGLIPTPQTTQQAYNADQARAYQQLTGDRPFRFPTMSLQGSMPIRTTFDRTLGTTTGRAATSVPFSYTAHPLTAEQTGADVTWLQQAIRQAEAKAGGAGGTTKAGVQGDIDAMKQRLGELRTAMGPQIQQLAQSEGQAYELYSKRYGIPKAFQMTTADAVGRLKKLGPEGAQQFAQAELSWARTVEQHNPKLKGQYDKLTQDIKDQFSAMGEHIAIINGQIYTGSKTEWNQITAAMQDPLEKAREKMGGAFTDIQNQALGSLTAMGFSHDQATALVHGLAAGGSKASAAAGTAAAQQAGQHGIANVGVGAVTGGTKGAATALGTQLGTHALGGRLRAAGGRIPGVGVADTVRMPDGGFGAPGELVVNPFTEADVSRDLQMAGRPTLAERVAREWRPAWMGRAGVSTGPATPSRFALGGSLSSAGATTQGAGGSGGYVFPFPSGASVTWERVDQGQDIRGPAGGYVLAVGPGNVAIAPPNPGGFGDHYPLLTLTSGPLMGKTLYYGHTKGLVTGAVGAGQTIAQTGYGRGDTSWQGNASGIPGHLEIGFWPPGSMSSGGAAAALMHSLASHTAIGGGGGAAGALGGIGQVSLHGLGAQGLGGVPGALLDRGSRIIAAGMQQKLNAKLASMGGTGGTASAAGISGNIMQIAQQAAAAAGLQFDANIVRVLLQKESAGGQNLPAHNYGGILNPAGPFQVISSTFNQYDPGGNIMNPADNALAAMRYIKSRYGSLAGMASTTGLMGGGYHGYSLGGRTASWAGWRDTGLDAITKPGQPVLFGAGERRQERVSVTPVHQRVPSGAASPTAGGGVHVSIGQITVQGSIRSDADIEQIGEHVAAKIIEAFDRGEHRAAETT